MSLKTKLYLSLSAIAVVLLISSIISIMEYGRMSNYVSGLVADNIKSINTAQKLADISNTYNLAVLAEIGDEKSARIPPFDETAFLAGCDSLRSSSSASVLSALADSVEYSYAAYLLTSLEMQNVISSRFIDTRAWYFDRLQPSYNKLNGLVSDNSQDLQVVAADYVRKFAGQVDGVDVLGYQVGDIIAHPAVLQHRYGTGNQQHDRYCAEAENEFLPQGQRKILQSGT